jgi:hypothetical protein
MVDCESERRRYVLKVVEEIQRFRWRGALILISASWLFLSLRCLKIKYLKRYVGGLVRFDGSTSSYQRR